MDLKQKGPLCVQKKERANVTPYTQEAPLMRLSVASLRRMIKRKLQVEFVHQELTSYCGLELLRRYLRQLDLPGRLHAACANTRGDYGGGRLALLILFLPAPLTSPLDRGAHDRLARRNFRRLTVRHDRLLAAYGGFFHRAGAFLVLRRVLR